MASADEIVQIAIDYSDQEITEIQENQGWTDPNYQADMQAIGWVPGDEWCAAAAVLTWKKGYADNPDVWAHAWQLVSLNCQDMGRNFHADPVWPTSVDMPKPGAIAIFRLGDSTKEGHCGIVTAINGNNFTTVEGNTSSPERPSEHDGWTVAAHDHTVGDQNPPGNLFLVRFIYAIESYDPLEY